MAPPATPSMNPYTTPIQAPPPGQTSNLYNDPATQEGAIIGVCVTFYVLTTVAVGLRVYTTSFVTKTRSYEDWICIFAALLGFTYMGFIIHLGYMSRHMWNVPMAWFTTEYWKLRFTQNELNAIAFFFSRMPIYLLYLRVFGHIRWFKWCSWAGMVAVFLVYLHTVIVIAVLCAPSPGQSWSSIDVLMQCSKATVDSIVQGACNIALDIYTLVLPLPVVLNLNLGTKRKWGVASIFLTGLLAVIASVVSFYYRYQLTYGHDTDWNEGAYDASSAVEINIAIIVSCMPALSSLFHRRVQDTAFFNSLRSVMGRKSRTGASGQSSGEDASSSKPVDPTSNKPVDTSNSSTSEAESHFIRRSLEITQEKQDLNASDDRLFAPYGYGYSKSYAEHRV